MIEIDGNYGEGGGQILRTALSLSSLLRKPVRISNIRKGRKRSGLMPQHLMCVRALKQICTAGVRGDEKGSVDLVFEPAEVKPGDYFFDIGTAGSTSLLLQAILPPLLFSHGRSTIILKGGTHVPFSPSFHYVRDVFVPIMSRMGLSVRAEIEKYGFYPKGGGVIKIEVAPASDIRGVQIVRRKEIRNIQGVSGVGNLPLSIAERQSKAAMKLLLSEDFKAEIKSISVPASGMGSFIFLSVKGDDCFGGFSSLGKRGKKAEVVGEEAARDFLDYYATSACLDHHVADQILLYLTMAKSGSLFTVSRITQHVLTNIWVIEQFLDISCKVNGNIGSAGEVAVSV